MTKAEAKRYVCAMAAEALVGDLDTGAEWTLEDPDNEYRALSVGDRKKVEHAIQELYRELVRRGSGY